MPRMLGLHDGTAGAVYRRTYAALEADFGPFDRPTLRLEAGRLAALRVALEAAIANERAVGRARQAGKGRRPSANEVRATSKRRGLDDGSYASALREFQELVKELRRQRPPKIADLVTRNGH